MDAIETVQTSLGTILVNDLTTGGITKALTAEMGKLLQDTKVDKVAGKSLLSETEIARLATLSNYTHPANHPPSIITQDTNNRFVTDTEKAIWDAKQSALGFTPENSVNKNAANGYAGLGSDGKLISSQLPSITISNTFVVASQAAMQGLTVETGDVAVRTDLNKSFILKGTDPTVLGDWQELLTPTDSVSTVFGRNGSITAQTGDYTADQITETATRKFQTANQQAFNDATSSIQSQLNTKATDANVVHTTGNESFTGVKSATNTGTSLTNGISLTNNGTGSSATSLLVNNPSSGTGISVNNGSGTGVSVNNPSWGSGTGVSVNNGNGSGTGISVSTYTGTAVSVNNYSGTGVSVTVNTGTGNGIFSNIATTGTGFNYVGQNNGSNTFTVSKTGATTASSFVKSGGTSSQFLKADGSVDSNSYQTAGATHYVGTTLIANNRASSPQTLTGISIDGNAGTASTLQTARTINGVSFNGSANITVADATKLPLTGGSISGDLTVISASNNNSPITIKFPAGANATRTGLLFKGNDGTYNYNYAELIGGVENWSADDGYLGFRTTLGTSLSEKMRLSARGTLEVGYNYTGQSGTLADSIIVENSIGVGTKTPTEKVDVVGNVKATSFIGTSASFSSSVQVGNNASLAAVTNVGAIRYRTSGNNSYADMCMQTGASTYEWVNIMENNW